MYPRENMTPCAKFEVPEKKEKCGDAEANFLGDD